MTGEHHGSRRADRTESASTPSPRISLGRVVRAAGRHVRRDPALALPFAAVGAIAAIADRLRLLDPIPATTLGPFSGTVSVRYAIVPRGVARTGRHLGAVPSLELPYLAWTVGLEALLVVAVGVAGYVTIARTLGVPVRDRPRSLARYLAFASGLTVSLQALGLVVSDPAGVLVSLVALLIVLQLDVRLALAPAYLVAGRGIASAVRASVAASRGTGWTLAGLVIAVGLAAWALAHVPVVGSLLSTAVVATIQSVALGVVVRWRAETSGGTPIRPAASRRS
ncbi:hypothetical protein [Halomicrobium salinisoli]|uniref:hypothetical protein n=1 Tax=Halomicrobium salinisoli TaxID=2878391 RepID=UPI001CEFEF58|nr:hypothetical protein [Halomicrobium salinisoli]